METIVQPSVPVGRLGLLAGSFNPPTRAHLALAEASLERVDATLLVIPRRLPHKDFTGASLDQRVAMMTRAVAGDPRLGVAISDGGLVVDMVREAHTHFAASAIHVVCGRDAAERYLTWNYGSPDAVEQMLKQFRLLVASRHGSFLAPEHLAHAIEHLQTVEMDEFSSSRLLELLRDGREDWRALAPDPIHDLIERIYR